MITQAIAAVAETIMLAADSANVTTVFAVSCRSVSARLERADVHATLTTGEAFAFRHRRLLNRR